jgi:hypothetical protein
MTTIITSNAYIVEGSGWDSVTGRTQIQEQLKQETIAFNSQGIPVTFNTVINKIKTETTDNQTSLLHIDATNYANLVDKKGTLTQGGEVALVDRTGVTFTQIYTNSLVDNNTRLDGIAYAGATISILALSGQYVDFTVAHERGHNLGLDHVYDVSGKVEEPSLNLMGYDRGANYYLNPDQVRLANTYLDNYPNSMDFNATAHQNSSKKTK